MNTFTLLHQRVYLPTTEFGGAPSNVVGKASYIAQWTVQLMESINRDL